MLGEIYDIKEDIDFLKRAGHKFKTNLDIEYVIHAYEEYGENILKKLNGKFVICIVNKIKNEVLYWQDIFIVYTFKKFYKLYFLINRNIKLLLIRR